MLEVLIRDYDCKVAGTMVTAKKIGTIIEGEAAVKRDSKKSLKNVTLGVSKSLRQLVTNEGQDSKELAFIGVPHGYEIKWEDLNISRDHEWETCLLYTSPSPRDS